MTGTITPSELNDLIQKANQGDAASQYSLGARYANGLGVDKDDKSAVHYYELAARQGYATAQYNLGYLYANGRGVDKNAKTAVHYYELAAKQGNANAQCNLGVMYANGQFFVKNDEIAIHYLELSVKQGNPNAQHSLGFMYANGRGVAKNDKTAVHYYELAAKQGFAFAQSNLGYMYEHGCGVEKNNKTAVHYYKLAAKQGDPKAQRNLVSILQKLNKETFFKFIDDDFSEILQKISDKAANNPDKYQKLLDSALLLKTTLSEKATAFFAHLDPVPDVKIFTDSCRQAINVANLEFSQHRGFGGLNAFIKGILGVLAAIAVIPALIVGQSSQEGYVGTFFGKPKTDSAKQLEGFEKGLDTTLNDIETVLTPK